MLRRRGMLSLSNSELPNGYKRCAYLSSSAKQYILTDIPLQDGLDITIELMRTNATDNYVFSGWDNASYQRSYFGSYKSCFQFNYGSYFYINRVTFMDNVKYKERAVSINQSGTSTIYVYIDDVLCDTRTANKLPQADSRFSLFARYQKGVVNQRFFGNVYSLYIVRSGEEILHFIPCLDRLGKPCMFDTVSKKPFYNLGTGEFGYELMDGTYVAPV